MKDRTQEFHAAVESMLQRGSANPYLVNGSQERSRLMAESAAGLSPTAPVPQTRSEFAKAASVVAKEINSTILKLHKLSQLARKKSLFDDRPVEISELIHIIKQDIAKVNRQIAALSAHVQQSKTQGKLGNRQVEEHATNVITSLQTRLASTSGEFKAVLEIRTQNIKEQRSRKEQYSFTPTQAGTPKLSASLPSSSSASQPNGTDPSSSTTEVSSIFRPLPRSDSPLYFPDRKNTADGTRGDVSLDLGGPAAQQQQLLVMNTQNANMEYLESRSQAIESIESTIAELGQIYQQFAQILSQQREMIQRIDDNVVDMESNVSATHDQLLKFFQNLSSNRMLMVKVFAALIFFFLVFVVVT
ncbi:cis-Golgi t-SNARE syntaxin [Phlyctochytrium bullatum]|nr:cis-Golgi t-SNARE syntaxin [Phlyctochytrium bullatum]